MSNQPAITEAIQALRPSASFSVRIPEGSGAPVITWHKPPEGGIPTQQAINAKLAELTAIREQTQQIIETGFPVEGKEWALAIGERDQDLLTKYAIVIDSSIRMGAIDPQDGLQIKDSKGTIHTLPAAELLTILNAYGLYIVQLYWQSQ